MCIVDNWQELVRNACEWDDVYLNNTPYVTLVRLCKLQMKHIPLGGGNLIVQEFM